MTDREYDEFKKTLLAFGLAMDFFANKVNEVNGDYKAIKKEVDNGEH